MMRKRKPRRGELNHRIQRVLERSYELAHGDAARAIPFVLGMLSKLPKELGVRETIVEYDTELVPRDGTWTPGPMASFVECLRVVAYRKRPNRTLAEHRVSFVCWPDDVALLNDETNPMMSSTVNDPHGEFVLQLKRTQKGKK